MRWEVGLTVNGVEGVYHVLRQDLDISIWDNAVEHAMDVAQALYPDEHIELDFVKEYDDA